MAPRLTLGSCAIIFVLPCSVRPGKFLSNSPAVVAQRWHNMLRLLGLDVDRSGNLQDNL